MGPFAVMKRGEATVRTILLLLSAALCGCASKPSPSPQAVDATADSSRSPQEVLDGVGKPFRRWLGTGRVCKAINYHQAGDFTA
jgi:anti-sigma factor ChrR (cupin superfamily)